MSLSGRLPTSVSSLSSRNRLPAFGPRLTTSNAVFGGNASMTEESAGASSPGSASSASAPVKIIDVVSPADETTSMIFTGAEALDAEPGDEAPADSSVIDALPPNTALLVVRRGPNAG